VEPPLSAVQPLKNRKSKFAAQWDEGKLMEAMAERQAVVEPARGQNAYLGAIVGRLRPRFQELYGERLVKLLLYGSQARREAGPHSDIDVLVVLKGPVRPGQEIERTGDIVAELSLEFDTVIECLFVEEARFAAQASAVIERAVKEGVPI